MTDDNGKATTKPQQLKQTLERARPQFMSVLRNPKKVERLIRSFGVAAAGNQNIYECTVNSILQTAMEAANLDLTFSRSLCQAYVVPRKKRCTFMTGYRGMIELGRRSREVVAVYARNVYAAEEFEVVQGTDERIRHVPCLTGEPGDYIGSYAVGVLRNGTRQFDWMTNAQVEHVRRKSSAGKSGPWVTDTDEMRRKCPTRRLFKYLPMSADLAHALEIEDMAEAGIDPEDMAGVEPVEVRDTAEEVGDDVDKAMAALTGDAETAEDVDEATQRAYDAELQALADLETAPAGKQTELEDDGDVF